MKTFSYKNMVAGNALPNEFGKTFLIYAPRLFPKYKYRVVVTGDKVILEVSIDPVNIPREYIEAWIEIDRNV